MKDFHRRGNGSMSNYTKDYAEIFDNQPEDLRENEMVDWDTMKRLWMELVDEDFFVTTKVS